MAARARRFALLAVLLAIGVVWWRYRELRHLERELPKLRIAYMRVGALASSLKSQHDTFLSQSATDWNAACVTRSYGSTLPAGTQRYRGTLTELDDRLDQFERWEALPLVLPATHPEHRRLKELHEWVRTEATTAQWSCESTRWLERIQSLRAVLAAHEACARALGDIDPRLAVAGAQPEIAACDEGTDVSLPGPAPTVVADAAPQGPLRGRIERLGTGQRDDEIVSVLAAPGAMQRFVVSPDGTRVAYVVRRGNRWVVVVDGQPSRIYSRVWTGLHPATLGGPTFSADSRHVTFRAEHDGEWFAVTDGRETPVDAPPVESRGGPPQVAPSPAHIASPDGRRTARIAHEDRAAWVVVDAKRYGPYPYVHRNIVFSPDSRRAAWIVRDAAGFHVVVDGDVGAAYPEILQPSPHFSPDGRRIAFVARRDNRELVVVDGDEQAPYHDVDAAALAFSPDSTHVAYPAWQTGWRLVVDGQEGRETFIGFVPGAPIVFPADDRLVILAQATGDLDVVRYHVTLPPAPIRAAAR